MRIPSVSVRGLRIVVLSALVLQPFFSPTHNAALGAYDANVVKTGKWPPALVVTGSHNYTWEIHVDHACGANPFKTGAISVTSGQTGTAGSGVDLGVDVDVGSVMFCPTKGGKYAEDIGTINIPLTIDVVNVGSLSGPDNIQVNHTALFTATTVPPGYEGQLRWLSGSAGKGSGPSHNVKPTTVGAWPVAVWVLLNGQQSPQTTKTVQAVKFGLNFDITGPPKGHYTKDIVFKYKETLNDNATATVYDWSASGISTVAGDGSPNGTVNWAKPNIDISGAQSRRNTFSTEVNALEAVIPDKSSGLGAKIMALKTKVKPQAIKMNSEGTNLKSQIDSLQTELKKTISQTVSLAVTPVSVVPAGVVGAPVTKSISIGLSRDPSDPVFNAYGSAKAAIDAAFAKSDEVKAAVSNIGLIPTNAKIDAIIDLLNELIGLANDAIAEIDDFLSVVN